MDGNSSDSYGSLGLWWGVKRGWGARPGGLLQKFLPGCVCWGFSNPSIVVHAKNNKDIPIMVLG